MKHMFFLPHSLGGNVCSFSYILHLNTFNVVFNHCFIMNSNPYSISQTNKDTLNRYKQGYSYTQTVYMICQGWRSRDTKVNKKHKSPSLMTLKIWRIRCTSQQRRENSKRRNGDREGRKESRRE